MSAIRQKGLKAFYTVFPTRRAHNPASVCSHSTLLTFMATNNLYDKSSVCINGIRFLQKVCAIGGQSRKSRLDQWHPLLEDAQINLTNNRLFEMFRCQCIDLNAWKVSQGWELLGCDCNVHKIRQGPRKHRTIPRRSPIMAKDSFLPMRPWRGGQYNRRLTYVNGQR